MNHAKYLWILVLVLAGVAAAQSGQYPSTSPPAQSTPPYIPQSTTASSSSQSSTEMNLQNDLVATEKKLWEAWKNKDAATFERTLAPNAMLVDQNGVQDRAKSIQNISSQDCTVRSYSLDDTKLTKIDTDTALLTYRATQDATCNGNKIPDAVNASTIYKRTGGNWQAAFHQETPVASTSTTTGNPR